MASLIEQLEMLDKQKNDLLKKIMEEEECISNQEELQESSYIDTKNSPQPIQKTELTPVIQSEIDMQIKAKKRDISEKGVKLRYPYEPLQKELNKGSNTIIYDYFGL